MQQLYCSPVLSNLVAAGLYDKILYTYILGCKIMGNKVLCFMSPNLKHIVSSIPIFSSEDILVTTWLDGCFCIFNSF